MTERVNLAVLERHIAGGWSDTTLLPKGTVRLIIEELKRSRAQADNQAPKAVVAQPVDERTAFERWFDYEGIEKYRSGAGYADEVFQMYWAAWQARAALTLSPQAQTPPPQAVVAQPVDALSDQQIFKALVFLAKRTATRAEIIEIGRSLLASIPAPVSKPINVAKSGDAT